MFSLIVYHPERYVRIEQFIFKILCALTMKKWKNVQTIQLTVHHHLSIREPPRLLLTKKEQPPIKLGVAHSTDS